MRVRKHHGSGGADSIDKRATESQTTLFGATVREDRRAAAATITSWADYLNQDFISTVASVREALGYSGEPQEFGAEEAPR